MENKFYVPELEEFCIGFEYQELNHKNEWFDKEYGSFLPKTISQYIKDKEIRVKHLDREDIEAEGWNYSNLAKNYCIIDDKQDGINTLGLWLNIVGDKIQIIDCRIPMHEVLFYGTIKNKTELRKLMIQLNIKTK
tara:strand:+ start:192 stop:596 length:405 start_codon:yes stop_codon:yes gene_type:complete